MSAKKAGLMLLGVLSVVLGGWLGLMAMLSLIAIHLGNIWELLGLFVRVVLGAYFLYIGIRAISRSLGKPQQKTRFGWGRILLGSFVIYSSVLDYLHLLSGPIKQLQPENETQAQAMHVTQIAGLIFCAGLVFSGIWQGLRKKQEDEAAMTAVPHT